MTVVLNISPLFFGMIAQYETFSSMFLEFSRFVQINNQLFILCWKSLGFFFFYGNGWQRDILLYVRNLIFIPQWNKTW